MDRFASVRNARKAKRFIWMGDGHAVNAALHGSDSLVVYVSRSPLLLHALVGINSDRILWGKIKGPRAPTRVDRDL